MELARHLVSGPPLVFAAIKEEESRRYQVSGYAEPRYCRQLSTVDTLYSSEDQLEGARAFAEKRAPVWKGK